MHDDWRNTDPSGKKNYKQPLLHGKEDSKFESNHVMRSPSIITTAVLVDSVSLNWGLLHLGWIPCLCHSVILWKSCGEEVERKPSSQKQQQTPPKQISLDNLPPSGMLTGFLPHNVQVHTPVTWLFFPFIP